MKLQQLSLFSENKPGHVIAPDEKTDRTAIPRDPGLPEMKQPVEVRFQPVEILSVVRDQQGELSKYGLGLIVRARAGRVHTSEQVVISGAASIPMLCRALPVPIMSLE